MGSPGRGVKPKFGGHRQSGCMGWGSMGRGVRGGMGQAQAEGSGVEWGRPRQKGLGGTTGTQAEGWGQDEEAQAEGSGPG